jgi:hypothetical protein
MSISVKISVKIPACGEPQEYAEHELQVSPRTYECHQTLHPVLTCHRCQWAEGLGVPLQPMCETKLPEGHIPTSGGMTLAPVMKCHILFASSFYNNVSISNYKTSTCKMTNELRKICKDAVMT